MTRGRWERHYPESFLTPYPTSPTPPPPYLPPVRASIVDSQKKIARIAPAPSDARQLPANLRASRRAFLSTGARSAESFLRTFPACFPAASRTRAPPNPPACFPREPAAHPPRPPQSRRMPNQTSSAAPCGSRLPEVELPRPHCMLPARPEPPHPPSCNEV